MGIYDPSQKWDGLEEFFLLKRKHNNRHLRERDS
jgi:hypothetical protein